MSHKMLDLRSVRISVVSSNNTEWSLQPIGEGYHLVVDSAVKARFWFMNDRLVVNYRNAHSGVIVVDGKAILYTNRPEYVPSGSLVELTDRGVEITTTGALANFLAGYFTYLAPLEEVRKSDPYGHIANALSVWDDTAVSPDCLLPTGRAVYDLIVKITGQQYRDSVK